MAQWFWRRFLIQPTLLQLFPYYLPFEGELALNLNKLKAFPYGYFVPSFVEICIVAFRSGWLKIEMFLHYISILNFVSLPRI